MRRAGLRAQQLLLLACAAGRMTTQFTCFTGTKVQILTQKGVAGRAVGAAAVAAARKRRWAHAVVEVLG